MVEKLLSRLDGVSENGRGKWLALCPSHADRRPSLSVTEAENGMVLVKCWAGCSFHEITSATGVDPSDLFPKTNGFDHHKKQRPQRVINASDGLRLLDYEAEVLQIVAGDLERCARTGERLDARTLPAIQNAQRAIRNVMREVSR